MKNLKNIFNKNIFLWANFYYTLQLIIGGLGNLEIIQVNENFKNSFRNYIVFKTHFWYQNL